MRTLYILALILIGMNSYTQEDCGSAVNLPYGVTYSGDNIGANPDNDYSTSTGCTSSNYNSSHWYSFTTPVGVSSVNLTFTSGSIGSSALITLVDDCSSTSSFNFIWFECDASSISGSFQTICNLIPSTTYYIQIASQAADEGTFDLLVQDNPLSPVNDICINALPIPGGPELLCMGGASVIINGDANACPDPEATGCMSNSTPGVWYYFDVPIDFEYNMITFSPQSGAQFELFSAPAGCGSLTFEICQSGTPFFAPMAGTRYYILFEGQLLINPVQSIAVTDCNSPWGDLNNGGAGTGGTDIAMNSCVPGDPTLPCENDNVIFYDYVVGCVPTDLTISIEQWSTSGGVGAMIDGGIMAIADDCSTLMGQYDVVNGTGYVCSGIVNGEDLILNGIPPGTEFLIAVGSDNPDQGYFEITVTESNSGGSSNNDLCVEAITVQNGNNTNFTNVCATSDLIIPGCSSQSASTVWFYYDPGPNPQDITINLNSTGIGSTGIAAWESCSGSNVDSECGNVLELFCIDVPIYIEVGSSVPNEGTFDLNISSSTSMIPPGLDVTPIPICSYESTALAITIESGAVGDIIISEHNTTSSDIMGQNDHIYQGVNTVFLEDILINCGTQLETAVYEVSVVIPGFNCQSPPVLIEIPVFPKLNVSPDQLEFCLPNTIDLTAGDYISGGSSPFQSYNWLWNGVTSESSNEDLDGYQLATSGYFDLEVTDGNGCTATTTIDITAHEIIYPFLTSDVFSACIGDPQFINITSQLQSGEQISNSIWTVLDESGNDVPVGVVASANTFIISTSDLLPGTYTIEATVTDEYGCENEATTIDIIVFPRPAGEIELVADEQCNTTLKIVFYGPNGEDLYGNGPDSDGDGIPDQFDLDNNGIPDFQSIEWLTPSQGSEVTNELTYMANGEGIYHADVVTTDNCLVSFTSPYVIITNVTPPVIMGADSVCYGETTNLFSDISDFVSVEWLDENYNVLSNSSSIDIDIQENTTIYLEGEVQGGCIKSDTIEITLLPVIEAEITGSTSFCQGETTVVSGVGDTNLVDMVWLNSNNQILSTSSQFMVSDSGNYFLVTITQFGCTDTLGFEITENDELSIQVSSADICDDDTIMLNAGPGFDNYLWTEFSGDSLYNDQSLLVDEAGVYIVQVSNGQCTGSDTIEVMMYTTPIVDLDSLIEVCNSSNLNQDTIINFTQLTSSSDSGQWNISMIPQLDLSNLDSVSFSTISSGTYQLIYTSTGAQFPCLNQSDTLSIEVSDCDCPFLELANDERYCNTEPIFDLNSIMVPGTESGFWELVSGPQMISIDANNEVLIGGAEEGNYIFRYTLDNLEPNCAGEQEFTLSIVSPPIVALDSKQTLCNQESDNGPNILDLNGALINGQGDWLDPDIDGLDFSDIANLDFTGIIPGNYQIEFLSNNAEAPCNDFSEFLEIEVIDCSCPVISLLSIPDQCNDGSSINLEDYEGISETGSWELLSSNPTQLDFDGNYINIMAGDQGLYLMVYVLSESVMGCPDMDTISFNIYDAPEIIEIMDTTVCNMDGGQGEHILDLNGLVSGSYGNWLNSDGSPILNPEYFDFTNYQIGDIVEFIFETNEALFPCENVSESVFITIKDCSCIEPIFTDTPVLCNTEDQELDLSTLVQPSDEGVWFSANPEVLLPDNIFNPNELTEGIYEMVYILNDQPNPDCQTDWSVYVEVVEQLDAMVDETSIVCTTNFHNENTVVNLFELISSGFLEGQWIDQNNNKITTAEAIDFLNEPSGTYTFTYLIENELPCMDQLYQIDIIAQECSEEYRDTIVNIGNIFSPNGDQINDIIFPETNVPFGTVKHFMVFDRWGNKIFHSKEGLINDPQFGWDGRFNGKFVMDGVYVYWIEIEFENGKQQILTGDVTVVK